MSSSAWTSPGRMCESAGTTRGRCPVNGVGEGRRVPVVAAPFTRVVPVRRQGRPRPNGGIIGGIFARAVHACLPLFGTPGSSPRRTARAFAAARRRRRGTAGRWAYPWRRMSGTAWGASRAAAGACALLCISLLGRFVMISKVALLRYRVLLVSGMRLGFKSAREGCSE
jgi:hypothetical protein